MKDVGLGERPWEGVLWTVSLSSALKFQGSTSEANFNSGESLPVLQLQPFTHSNSIPYLKTERGGMLVRAHVSVHKLVHSKQ